MFLTNDAFRVTRGEGLIPGFFLIRSTTRLTKFLIPAFTRQKLRHDFSFEAITFEQLMFS